MRVLIGTTNPAKVTRFEEFLPDSGIKFLTLKDLGITAEPHESGESPESEMQGIGMFDELPENLTYPQTSPVLYREAEKFLKSLMQQENM